MSWEQFEAYSLAGHVTIRESKKEGWKAAITVCKTVIYLLQIYLFQHESTSLTSYNDSEVIQTRKKSNYASAETEIVQRVPVELISKKVLTSNSDLGLRLDDNQQPVIYRLLTSSIHCEKLGKLEFYP
jgi:hypothetical protein